MKRQRELYEIWDQQESYNTLIRNQQKRTNSEWLINYILGAHSELSELLDQTNWKTHRISSLDASLESFGPNIQEELADITKYIFSMWQLIGFSPLDMLEVMYKKGDILNQLMFQETRPAIQQANIIMLDLDGVIADFRRGFMEWIADNDWKDILTIKEEDIGLHLDINNGWDFKLYNRAKVAFEKDGGYSLLPIYTNTKMAINTLRSSGWYIIVYTARPYSTYKRIWGDTWIWLRDNDITVDELHFGYDDRVLVASDLAVQNHVVAIEDDPLLIRRYNGSNIPVFIYPQPYNQHLFVPSRTTHLIEEETQFWKISNAIEETKEDKTHAR